MKSEKELRKELKACCEDMRKELAHWQEIKECGCYDPLWPDGANMNLVRNHILYDKRRILEITGLLNIAIPDAYYQVETPPKVPDNYLAKNGEYFAMRKQTQRKLGYKITTTVGKNKDLSGSITLF